MRQKNTENIKKYKEFDMDVADFSANVGNNREIKNLYLEFSSDNDNDNVASKSFILVLITKNQF